ncbi:hypothetical protein C7B61_11835 [filamentous cyanobacterium CCP1]|nr:hypothetical protein C7B76_07655 [filamentous cyanobacterium CCP2]PSB64802.1 hypothetical protein C7B61_11835 [filamentous cyanobacterium CCP1]
MKTIETIATVNHEGKLTIELASDLPPGTHRAVVVIDEALLAQTAATNKDLTAHSSITNSLTSG